jgi:hypothetical protein
MPSISLFGINQQGKSATVTSQSHLNLYAEIIQDVEKSSVVYYGTAGLLSFTSFGDTPVRGGIVVGDFMYLVHRGVFYEVNNAGVKTNRGTLNTTSGRVSFTNNGIQIAFIDGINYYVYTIATTTLSVVTTNLVGVPIDVTFQDGYGLLAYADGKFQKTSAYAFQTLNALEYATAESNPDGLSRVIADHGEIILAGTETVEFWGNTGGADFPYSNQRGSTLEFGLAAPWSLVKYNDSLAGLFKNKMGQVQVMMMAGHALKKISSNELDYIINNYTSVSDATAYSYMLAGHPMYQINFRAQGKSWLYDASTGLWSSLESDLYGGRHRGEILLDYINKPRVTDYSTGDVYTLDANTYTDNGLPIPREITTKHIGGGLSRLAISRLYVGFETGQGLISGQGSNPQVMLKISKDNGHTWGNEIWRDLGKIGTYLSRVIWHRLGSSYDWVFKIRITDPVKVVIVDGAIN